jgi:hypothetical protein
MTFKERNNEEKVEATRNREHERERKMRRV